MISMYNNNWCKNNGISKDIQKDPNRTGFEGVQELQVTCAD